MYSETHDQQTHFYSVKYEWMMLFSHIHSVFYNLVLHRFFILLLVMNSCKIFIYVGRVPYLTWVIITTLKLFFCPVEH